jgi:pimeloyl-ACP methyl ester carboxylesterase
VFHWGSVGDGRPLLVLHGGYLDHRHMLDSLEPVFEGRAGWRRLYIDLPGHGQSAVNHGVASQDDVLGQILEFVDHVIPGERFAVAGESRGGYLARGIVHRRPDQVAGALFIAPGRYAEAKAGSVPEHVTLVEAESLESGLAPAEAARFRRLVVQSSGVLQKIRALRVPAAALADHAHMERIQQSYEFSFDVDRPDRPFEALVLFVLGRQDAMVGYTDSLQVMALFPRGTFAVLDRAGHSLAWGQPVLFGALVGEWLGRVDEAERLRANQASRTEASKR